MPVALKLQNEAILFEIASESPLSKFIDEQAAATAKFKRAATHSKLAPAIMLNLIQPIFTEILYGNASWVNEVIALASLQDARNAWADSICSLALVSRKGEGEITK
jgi:hypothetical protein